MVYSDIIKYGLCGILPHKKRYGTQKDIKTVEAAIKANSAFCQFAMNQYKVDHINGIIGKLTRFVLMCNEVYNDDN